MASLYMRIEGQTPKGAATAEFTGGDSLAKDGWFTISSFQWGAVRSVGMNIGDGFNADSGMVGMQELVINKVLCGASENILSCLYIPGAEGKIFDLIATKPDRIGQGVQVYLQIKLEKARIVSYSVSGSDGSQPSETIAVAYNLIKIKHWHESASGELEPGGLVTFDLPTGKLLSGNK